MIRVRYVQHAAWSPWVDCRDAKVDGVCLVIRMDDPRTTATNTLTTRYVPLTAVDAIEIEER